MDEYGKIKIEGYIGRLIENCIGNGVMAADYQPFIKAFQEKLDSEGLFCGEFWGKWFTSAALAYEYNPRPEYLKNWKMPPKACWPRRRKTEESAQAKRILLLGIFGGENMHCLACWPIMT